MKSFNNLTAKIRFGGLVAALLTVACTSARAQVLFNNGSGDPGVNGAQGYFADTGNPQYAAGDVFTPILSGTANSVSFAGFYYNGGTPTTQPSDSFTIYLYSVTPGSPDAPDALIGQATLSDETSSVFATSNSTTPLPGNFPIYQFSGNLSVVSGSFALDTSSEYFLGISDTTNPSSEFAMDVTPGYVGPATNGWGLTTGTLPGDPSNSIPGVPFAFSVNANFIPEPSTWALMLGGMALLAIWRVQTRRA
jgi:hypothetical protein